MADFDENNINSDNDNNEYEEESSNLNDSFYDPYSENENANAFLRESTVDASALSVDPELLQGLRALKRAIYNAVIFGPPAGSEAAQDLRNLQVYEGLLLELNNLLAAIFEGEAQTTADPFAHFPESVHQNARAYYLKVVEFKNGNTKPYLNDVLVDLFDRTLREHPY